MPLYYRSLVQGLHAALLHELQLQVGAGNGGIQAGRLALILCGGRLKAGQPRAGGFILFTAGRGKGEPRAVRALHAKSREPVVD